MQVGLRLILAAIAGATLVTFLFARGGVRTEEPLHWEKLAQ